MYTVRNKKAAISSLQRYLGEIYKENKIYENGVYDEKTKEAVIKIQKKYGIEPSGVTDYKTFNAILTEYKKSLDKKAASKKGYIRAEPTLRIGYFSDEMRILNRDIALLLDRYGIHHNIRKTPCFTKETELGVKELRKIMRLSDEELIDPEFLLRLSEDLYGNK